MSFDVQLFPSPDSTDTNQGVGICFSGGGSRALSAAMGQMRGLQNLGVLDKVAFISSVSGGTWASALWVYLPSSFSEDDFLGPVVEPQNLSVLTICEQPPNHLGSIPPQLNVINIVATLTSLAAQGYPADALWQGLIGTYVLQPFNLWNQNLNGFPDKYYAPDLAALDAPGGILARNSALNASQFYLRESARPVLVMNSSVVSNSSVDGSQLLPFESTPEALGVRSFFSGVGANGQDVGGGLMEPFAMGSSWQQDLSGNPGETLVDTTQPARPFSLCDIVGISSAAFVETFQKSFSDLDFLIPAYPYWPVENRAVAKNAASSFEFADGGNLEDTGICALLARGLPKIIAFVNGQTPLAQTDSGEIVVDSQIQLLFGVPPTPASLARKEVTRKDIPNDDLQFVQVFNSGDYNALAEGLWAANNAGGPAMFAQTLTTMANTNFGVESYTVEVLWVYNTWVQNWYKLLDDGISLLVDTTLNFPNFDTVLQLDLSAAEVNLLANLSCWNLLTNSAMVMAMFGG
jgi:hypothetical protein